MPKYIVPYGVLTPSPLKRALSFKEGDTVNIVIEVMKDTISPYLDYLITQPNLKSFAKTAAAHMKESVLKNFEYEGRPTRWQQLSKKYMLWKLKHRFPLQILKLTGKLIQSIRTSAAATKTTATSFVYVADLLGYKRRRVREYAKAHQYGTRKLPARPFLLFQDEDKDQIVKYATDMLLLHRG